MQELSTIFRLKPLEIEVYSKLFEKKDSSVKDLIKITEISQAKIYTILSILEEKGLVTSIPAETGRTRIYNAINPKKLHALQQAYIHELEVKSERSFKLLQQKFDRLHTRGVCQVKPTHFLITQKDFAISKIKEYISKAEKEIILIGVPIWLIDTLYEFLSITYHERDCNVELYVPDFEIIPTTYKKIEKFSPKIMRIPHSQLIEVNNKLYFNCEIIIDRKYMVGISYNEEYDIILNAFSGYNCISQCILPNLYNNLVKVDTKKPPIASKESRILNILKRKGQPLSKKDLSNQTGLSGQTLNKTLDKLVEMHKIKIYSEKIGKGRPRTAIELV